MSNSLLRNIARRNVARLIEFGRALPDVNSMADLCTVLVAAAAEIACRAEPNPQVTIDEFTKAVRVIYEANRKPKEGSAS